MRSAIVIGAGLSGLLTATALARAGLSVTCVHFGTGSLPLQPGVIDVYGYNPGLVASPMDAVANASLPHPYATIGAPATRHGLELLDELAGSQLLMGSADANVSLPTAVGAWRPASLYAPSMAAGVKPGPLVIVGLRGLRDFSPSLIAGNLGCRHAMIDVAPGAGGITPLAFARRFDSEDGQRELVSALAAVVGEGETVGLPAVLGLNNLEAWRQVQDGLGHPVFEIPLPPPSVPGLRLDNAIRQAASGAGVRFWHGAKVVGLEFDGPRAKAAVVASAGHVSSLRADAIVLATGGLASGGLSFEGRLTEPICDLPLGLVPDVPFTDDPLAPQPLWLAGVMADATMRPIDADGNLVCPNLYAVGGLLAGSARWFEMTAHGIAAGSASAAAEAIVGEVA